MSVKKFGIGQPVRRVEDQRLLTGGGRYTDDYAPERCLHAVVLRSPHAHARFTITDVETARAMKGVRLVLTAADVAHLGPVPCMAPMPNADGTSNLDPLIKKGAQQPTAPQAKKEKKPSAPLQARAASWRATTASMVRSASSESGATS